MPSVHAPFLLLLLCLAAATCLGCERLRGAAQGQSWRPMSPEKRAARASMVIKALVTNLFADPERGHKALVTEFWILDVYKGADKLAAGLGMPAPKKGGVFSLKDQRLNVSHFGDSHRCWNTPIRQKTYIVLLTSAPSSSSAASAAASRRSGYWQTIRGSRWLTRDFPGSGSSSGSGSFGLLKKPGPDLVARYDDPFGALIEFGSKVEKGVLKALGWHSWGQWSPCSQSCGQGGEQRRTRTCQPSYTTRSSSAASSCPSYTEERRTCNSFVCAGSIDTLSVEDGRYFKPSPQAFQKLPPCRRPAQVSARSAQSAEAGSCGWKIPPGSYFLLPFRQAFGREFPQDFVVFLTVKPTEQSEGIIFSINARNSRQEYISLELNDGRLELVHSQGAANGSKIIDIPARISDGGWHQLAISVEGGSTVRTYMDCHWVTTQILHRHSLTVPENADLIIGYMFQGFIEQLTVSRRPAGVSEQCSSTRVPYFEDDNDAKSGAGVGDDDDGEDDGEDDEEEDDEEGEEEEEIVGESESKKNTWKKIMSSSSSASDIDIEEDEAAEGGQKSKSFDPKSPSSPTSASASAQHDYLDEEYVDLDWNEETEHQRPPTTTTVKPRASHLNALPRKTKEKSPKMGSEKAPKRAGRKRPRHEDEGSGHDEEEEDDDIRVDGDGEGEGDGDGDGSGDHPGLEGSGGGGDEHFELEWSSWSECAPSPPAAQTPASSPSPCGPGGRQTRVSRCADNGFLEECIAAGMERVERRACRVTCPVGGHAHAGRRHNPSGWIAVVPRGKKEEDPEGHLERVTGRDIDTVRRARVEGHGGGGNVPTHVPSRAEEAEEHTNAIPHIPNYWAPEKEGKVSSSGSGSGSHRSEKKSSSLAPLTTASSSNSLTSAECGCMNGGSCLSVSGETGAGCQCPLGYEGPRCQRALCRPECLNGGECLAPNVCACPEGYTGARCQLAFCHPKCQNGGTCVAPFNCSCPLGISGAFCEGFSCQPGCANGGLCIGHNRCSCPHGFSGATCRDRTCTAQCENGGVCTMPSNKCKCPEGFYGAKCHKRSCRRYVPVRLSQRRVFRRVVDVEYETVCADGRVCTKTRPEYRTQHKLVVRNVYKCAPTPRSRPRRAAK